MVGIIKEIDGQKTIIPLTTDTGTGAPVGTLISQYRKVPTSGLAENQQDNVLKDVKDYVDNSNSYSTQEVKTGGKWIDGKPIYRKVITHTLSDALTGLVVIQHNIQNIETPIRIAFGKAKVPGGSGGITIPAQYDSTTFIQLGAFSDTYVQLFAGSTNWTAMKEITLCLEYTKTTD